MLGNGNYILWLTSSPDMDSGERYLGPMAPLVILCVYATDILKICMKFNDEKTFLINL